MKGWRPSHSVWDQRKETTTLTALRPLVLACLVLGWFAWSSAPSPAIGAGVSAPGAAPGPVAAPDTSPATGLKTATPIKHLVVIFQENVSFDHYFATYPHALNATGEPSFTAAANTPQANTLESAGLLGSDNPNSVQPFRLSRAQSLTCDQNHDYTAEQRAFDNGKMDKFVEYTDGKASNSLQYCRKGITMGYYDGNTVTALWNYAQHYAMSDNSFGTVFGPSTPGALQLVAGDTAGAACGNSAVYLPPAACTPTTTIPTGTTPVASGGTVYGDPDQFFDDCSSGGYGSKNTALMTGQNVGDLLVGAGIAWGWFNGGFADCKASHPAVAVDRLLGLDPAKDTTTQTGDYSAHHESFQYYASTSNPHHARPSDPGLIGGKGDGANHQYDLSDFWTAADAGNLPAVSYLKAPKYQDGHAGYSDPLDEQEFLVDTINHLQSLSSWASTAVIVAYDDSDGWYDHVPGPIVNHSNTSLDADPRCTTSTDGPGARCGYGPRLPLLVISPYARANYVDHTLTDQTSILRFVEDNWLGGQRLSGQSFDNKAGSIAGMFNFTTTPGAHHLLLNPQTGQPMNGFEINFTSAQAGQGYVYFGSGPGCLGLVQVATHDWGAGTTAHTVDVAGNDMSGTIGNIGIVPGTYWYEVVTAGPWGTEIDNNHGACYSVTIPAQ
jgi:phospholipase C